MPLPVRGLWDKVYDFFERLYGPLACEISCHDDNDRYNVKTSRGEVQEYVAQDLQRLSAATLADLAKWLPTAKDVSVPKRFVRLSPAYLPTAVAVTESDTVARPEESAQQR